MNIGAKYYLAIFLKNGSIVHKEFMSVYMGDEQVAIEMAQDFAKQNKIAYDSIDVTYTGDEQF